MQALEGNDLDEETLVIYTADHGYSLGHNGFWGHGQATWPANMHRAAFNVPLIASRPAHIEPAQKCDELVSQLDLFATLLDYIGIESDNLNGNSDSQNFSPYLKGEPSQWRDAIFMEQEETRAIRTAKWLYMKRFRTNAAHPLEDELYDLENDPMEKKNLIDDADFSEIATELSERIESFFNRHSDERYDLWHGGTTKSNSDKPWFWKEAWGPDWEPDFGRQV
jgi:arylsulfatase A-like enzyme